MAAAIIGYDMLQRVTPQHADTLAVPGVEAFVAGFASNQALGFQGNRDLFHNILAWLAGQEGEIAIRPKDSRQNPIALTAAESRSVLLLSIVVLPAAVMVAGIWRVVRRRRIK